MADLKLVAHPRNEFGKGASRRARREGLVPAVMYGGDLSGVHLLLPGHDVFLIVKDNSNAVVTVQMEDGDKQLALVKDVQIHPVSREILHVDLQAVKKGEKVEVEVPLNVVGESAPGTVASLEEFVLRVLAPATNIPESIDVSIEGMEEGDVVRVSDIVLPADVECDMDDDHDIVSISVPREEVSETEAGEAAEGAEGGEDSSDDSEGEA